MKILAVIDMQNDFITGCLGNTECKQTVSNVVELINTGDYDALVITYDTHDKDYLSTQEGRKLPVVHCVKGTDGWELNPLVETAIKKFEQRSLGQNNNPTVKRFEKPVFGSLEFAEYLKTLEDVTEIVFCGVCTGICVISNAMLAKAALPEATLKVVAKACACVTPRSHNTALEAMKLCQIEIV